MKKKFYKKTLILIFGGAVLFTSFGFKSDFFEIAKQIEIFTTLFKEINMNYVDETSPADLMDTAIKSMLTDLDPYTNFWSEQDVQSSRINMEGEYTGIGAAFVADPTLQLELVVGHLLILEVGLESCPVGTGDLGLHVAKQVAAERISEADLPLHETLPPSPALSNAC